MIKAYQYIDTDHSKLHQYVMAFFKKIETCTGEFSEELFDPEFLPIVNSHYKILKSKFKEIYIQFSDLSEENRKLLCDRIIKSNEIEKICRGEYRPAAFPEKPSGIEESLKDLFVNLYDQVLSGNSFQNSIKKTLRDHFDEFSQTNEDITLCPLCGIGELKKAQDETRDQYDHYLSKTLYPFSSVNFHNLVLSCKECNSFDVKGNKDIIAISTGKLFFPYDDKHQGVSLVANVSQDNTKLEEIKWDLVFSNSDGKDDEIESWKRIYSIDSRYKSYISGRIKKWYSTYYDYLNSSQLAQVPIEMREICYMESIKNDDDLGLSYIRKPALEGLLSSSPTVKAKIESVKFS
ncbi:hypothetical protein [Priestia aryabhattai]|uniref:hypothetical protein n=1 Tax=Priestia aryabhattai TaxID=412384 RepID=UPI001CBA8107|nr:hypothetical protein [Priestia aryabhattai]